MQSTRYRVSSYLAQLVFLAFALSQRPSIGAVCKRLQLSDLRILRFLVIVVVGFAGFFRIDEMLSIKLRSVQLHGGHMQMTLPHCKNDQMRKGNEILVARTNSAYWPVGLTELFWQKAQMDGTNSDTFFIPRLLTTKSGHAAHKSAGISYTTAYEQFEAFIQPATT